MLDLYMGISYYNLSVYLFVWYVCHVKGLLSSNEFPLYLYLWVPLYWYTVHAHIKKALYMYIGETPCVERPF